MNDDVIYGLDENNNPIAILVDDDGVVQIG